MTGQADDFLFWKFLRLDNGALDQVSFSLAHIMSMYQGDSKPELLGHLLRAQASAVHDLVFERLRSPGSIDWARKYIPNTLRFADFLHESKWRLVLCCFKVCVLVYRALCVIWCRVTFWF